ncbi:cellulose-binding domain-containing protein [Streptomyces sp. YS415]|uniref:cellulose-binding domain-containing protein n=1 Tax=Streptomyces sp. YS415 TaxID=2944806 RepID=UPI002020F13F|nr:cellulose-binding domain-containing protein [Streptomyces sp. YS415]MCL7424725.1 cellulose-binding domain-containing protein [Streptomyces sp. YS415]
MPDLPTPQDATEAALFSECWDAVLSYADLCTAGSTAATELATEAFSAGMREVRAAKAHGTRYAGRRSPRLPRIPLLLTAVRTAAADWEVSGRGSRLDPDLRLWLNSGKAARYTGPPQGRPLALRGLRDMQQPDAELLWLAEVEALPLSVVARRLGLDPATVSDELAQVRGLFRDRCHRNLIDAPQAPGCRGYVRLLDAVTRSPVTEVPADLSQHLARCADCAEAAACLRLHGVGLPAALAGGVLGWGGLAYLERRRRAAEVRLGAGRPGPPVPDGVDADPAAQKAKTVRNGLLVAAVLVSVLALAVSLMPFGGSGSIDDTVAGESARQPVADHPGPSFAPSAEADATTASPSARPSGGPADRTPERTPEREDPDPEPQGTATTTSSATATRAPETCRVRYDLVNQWPDGFQATVTVTTEQPLDTWRVAWSFREGQHIGQMWDADFTQNASRVTATATAYNKSVPAGGSLTFGFIASWQGRNSPAHDFSLNGRECGTT